MELMKDLELNNNENTCFSKCSFKTYKIWQYKPWSFPSPVSFKTFTWKQG